MYYLELHPLGVTTWLALAMEVVESSGGGGLPESPSKQHPEAASGSVRKEGGGSGGGGVGSKSGRAKRREKKLKNEPQNVTGGRQVKVYCCKQLCEQLRNDDVMFCALF